MGSPPAEVQASAPLALVTGASSGIGAEVARLLARRGFRTVLMARRRERIEALAAELSAHAPSTACPVDLADPAALEACVHAALDQHGPVRVLVNNAGYGCYQAFLDCPADEHDRLLEVNYLAAARLIRRVLPAMVAGGQGHVINIASVAATMAPWGHSGYAAAKAALVALTQSLAAEYSPRGVRFSYVNPGIVSTEFFSARGYEGLFERNRRRALPADRAARQIVALLDRPRLELYIPGHYRLFNLLASAWPSLAHRIAAAQSRPNGKT